MALLLQKALPVPMPATGNAIRPLQHTKATALFNSAVGALKGCHFCTSFVSGVTAAKHVVRHAVTLAGQVSKYEV